MRSLLLRVAAATSLLAASIAVSAAKAEPSPHLIFGVDRASEAPFLTPVQFIFGGRTFCWYDSGWSGPGFYWCGYAMRSGMGWGGGAGWHGWQRGGGGAPQAVQAHRSGGAPAAASHDRAQTAAAHGAAHDAAGHSASHGDDDKRPAN